MVRDQIEHDVDIDAPVERVWAVITEPEHVRAWYAFDGAEIDGGLTLGGKTGLRFGNGFGIGATVGMRPKVLRVRRPRVKL